VSAADFRGKKKLVVSFWASWCGPCRMEMPMLAKFYRQTHKGDADYEMVSVSVDADRADAETAATQLKVPVRGAARCHQPDLADVRCGRDSGGILIDKDGKVIHGEVASRRAWTSCWHRNSESRTTIPWRERRMTAAAIEFKT